MPEPIKTEPTGAGARTLAKLREEIEREKQALDAPGAKDEAAKRVSDTFQKHQPGRRELSPEQKRVVTDLSGTSERLQEEAAKVAKFLRT